MRILLLLSWLLLPCEYIHAEFAQIGPVENLNNGTVSLDIALRVGRITSYQRSGESNWLGVFDEAPNPGWNWNPWGGDRMWPTSQALNAQIYRNNGFDPIIDGQPWDLLSKTATSLEMRSGISPQLGLQVTHRIELIGKTTEVLHTYRLERVSESHFPVHVWAVTGVKVGDVMLMESDPRVGHEGYKPYKPWVAGVTPPDATLLPGTRILQVSVPEIGPIKLGTYGRWIAQVSGTAAFLQTTSYDADLLYLEGSNLQAFMDPSKNLYEIETLSPTWFLAKGETREWTVRWRLLDFPADAVSIDQRACYLSGLTRAP